MSSDAVGIAEQYVIGAILTDQSVLRAVQQEVAPGDFRDMRLGDIYRGICAMAATREPIDYLTVWGKLSSWDVRGIDLTELSRWANDVPTASSAGFYARTVREGAVSRALVAVGERLRSEAAAPEAALSSALTDLHAIRDRDVATDDMVPTLGEVLDVPESEDAYDWVVPGLLERRDRLMLTGSEGGGKSTLLRQIAVLSAAGIHPFRFSPIDPVRVLVVDAENSTRQWRRAVRGMADEAALRGRRDPRAHLGLKCLERSVDITRTKDQGEIHRWIEQVRPDVLLIGPLYRLVPKSIKDDDVASPILAILESFRDHGVAMLIEAHAGHAMSESRERDLRPRGSAALLGWPEFGLGLRREKAPVEGGRVPFSLVRWRGDRDRREWPTRLVRGQVWPWEPTASVGGR